MTVDLINSIGANAAGVVFAWWFCRAIFLIAFGTLDGTHE